MVSTTQRMAHIDGLKGIAAILISLRHYLISFGPFGYIGWQSGVDNATKADFFWASFPMSLFVNSDLTLFLFFALIAFIPAMHFFQTRNETWIRKQAIVRYFSLLPYVVIPCLLSYACYHFGWYYHKELGDLLGINWNKALFYGDFSLLPLLYASFFKDFITTGGGYISSLWCINIIFMGSYFAYTFILFFAKLSKRVYIYLIAFLILLNAPAFLPFLIGILVADIYVHKINTLNIKLGTVLLILALLLYSALESSFTHSAFLALSMSLSLFIILLTSCTIKKYKHFLENKYLVCAGRYSFSLIIVHMIIMSSISAKIFIVLYAFVGYYLSLFITFAVSIVINIVATYILDKLTTPLSKVLSSYVYKTLKD